MFRMFLATRYGLGGPGIEFQWELGAIFSAPVQTGSGAHPPLIQTVPGLSRGYSGRGVALEAYNSFKAIPVFTSLQNESFDKIKLTCFSGCCI